MIAPDTLYKAIVLRVGASLEASGAVDQDYFDGFLQRNHRGIKAAILTAWPALPLPRREDYRGCTVCGHVAHHTDTGPHTIVMGIPCTEGRFTPLPPQGRDRAYDHGFNGILSRTVAQWGLCGRCGQIHRVTRDGRLASHTRPIDPDMDGTRKRKDPDCEGEHTAPVVVTPTHPMREQVRRAIQAQGILL